MMSLRSLEHNALGIDEMTAWSNMVHLQPIHRPQIARPYEITAHCRYAA